MATDQLNPDLCICVCVSDLTAGQVTLNVSDYCTSPGSLRLPWSPKRAT